jgi:membrane-bound lytic murein transglycosylase B
MPSSRCLRVLTLAVVCMALACAASGGAAKGRLKTRGDKAADAVVYGPRDDVLRYAVEVAERRGLDPDWVRGALQQARYLPVVARLVMPAPAGTAKNWAAYRRRFVEPNRVGAGVAFWHANEHWLQLAEELYGVPPEVVVGILGVETLYGQQTGNFRVIDALATLAFDFPAGRKDRSAFYRDELENYFVMCHSEGLDPLQPTGSFAGAMGLPQFMPSSYNRYAVDFDGDGHVDLRGSAADAIGSVAHYIAEFGWRRGLPTHFAVDAPVATVDRAALLVPDILPSFTLADFDAHGARLEAAAFAADVRLDASGGVGKLALVELQNGDAAPSYVAGTSNFYAITRYNWSSYYALAVIELGEAVARDLGRDAR